MKKWVIILIVIGIIVVIVAAGFYYISTIIPLDLLITGGPGGCRGPDCEQVCSENPEVCEEWCEENPEICQQFMGGGSEGFLVSRTTVIDPPNTVITFAKTLNLNANGFIQEDIIKAKLLGANMVTLWPTRGVKNDETTFYPYVGNIPQMINIAHSNGLQVELRSSIGSEIVNDYNKYKPSAISYVAEFAKLAEENNVYRIVPFGEIDNDMLNHCDKITEFAQELLTEMRKHYSGQIGVGVVGSWRDCGYSFEGYDYLTLSAYPQTQTGMDAWLTTQPEINLISVVDWARGVADRSNIQILHLGETGVFDSEDDQSLGGFNTVIVSEEKEAEFYEKLFDQIGSKVDGVSAFYNSKYNYIDINGDLAEEVVKDWYTNKL